METDSDLTDIDELEQTPNPSPKEAEYKLQGTLKPPHLAQYSAGSLYEWIHSGLIELAPPYQRDVVWGDAKQIKLIDSLLRNFYVPPIIFRVVEDESGMEKRICIDGKQRLTSIQRFMDGQIPHQDPVTKKKYWFKVGKQSGKSRKELLPKAIRSHLTMKQLACIDYRGIEGHHERDIFQRVQLGMPLNPAERMAAISGEWPDFVNDIKEKYMKEGQADNLCQWINFDTARGKDFLAITQVILGVHSLPSRTNFASPTCEKWLSRDDGPTNAFRKKIDNIFSTYSDLVSSPEYKQTVMQLRMAPLEFIMIALLLANHLGESSAELSRRVQQLRKGLRTAHQDIRTNNKVINTAYALIEKMESKGKGKAKATAASSKRKVDAESEEEEDYRPSPIKRPATGTRSRPSLANQQPIPPSTPNYVKPPPSSSSILNSQSRMPANIVLSQAAQGRLQTPHVGEIKNGVEALRTFQDPLSETPSQVTPAWHVQPVVTTFGGHGTPGLPISYMPIATPAVAVPQQQLGEVELWYNNPTQHG